MIFLYVTNYSCAVMSYRAALALPEGSAWEKTEFPESGVCTALLSGLQGAVSEPGSRTRLPVSENHVCPTPAA